MITSLWLTLDYMSSHLDKWLRDLFYIHIVVLLLWYIFPTAMVTSHWCAISAILLQGEVMAHHFGCPAIVFKLRGQDCTLSPVVEI